MEQPPSDTPEKLKRYLSTILQRLDDGITNSMQMPLLTAIPAKPIIGKQYYFNNAIATTAITSEGVWVYKSTGWSLLG